MKVKKLLNSGQGLAIPKRSVKKRFVRSCCRIDDISAAVERNPRKSVCALARSNNAARRAMQRVVHEALVLRSCGVSPTPF